MTTDITPEAVAKICAELRDTHHMIQFNGYAAMITTAKTSADMLEAISAKLAEFEAAADQNEPTKLWRFWSERAFALAAERDKWKKLTEASDDTRKVLGREWERSDAAWRARAEAADAMLAARGAK